MTKMERNEFFNGKRDADGKLVERGVIAMRGERAADDLRDWVEKVTEARANQSANE